MTTKAVVKMGSKELATPSIFLENFESYGRAYPGMSQLIEDMLDTMKAETGIGIAAPQIGCNLRVVIFGFEDNLRYPREDSIPLTILINPVIKVLSAEMEDGWEGCLSVPGLRGLVPRYTNIEYSGFEPDGNRIIRIAEGFHARVVQHECDHLDGILYPQRMKDLRSFGFEEELDL